jgi:site-specific DNA recombinase
LEKSTIAERTGLGRNRIAGTGGYTGGPIPLGYDVDAENRIVASQRIVPELGMTEAEFVRDLFQRMADGSITVNSECLRLTALGVPRGWRYGGASAGKASKAGDMPRPRAEMRVTAWSQSSLGSILHNPVYKGAGRLDSRFGSVPRVTPALVDAATWERAQAALLRNRKLSKKNATHTYLLRGLIRCENCGRTYVGSFGKGHRYYRCGASCSFAKPGARCGSKSLRANWLEDAVWQECRRFILNPGEALGEARRALRERMADATRFDAKRRVTLDALAAKETERERVLTMYRRGKINADEAERELDAIAREAGPLREELESMRAQSALVDIQEAHLTETAALLDRLRGELQAIDATNDLTRKREVIEHYVRQITVVTRVLGTRRKEADVRIALRLEPKPVAVETGSPRRSGPPRN